MITVCGMCSVSAMPDTVKIDAAARLRQIERGDENALRYFGIAYPDESFSARVTTVGDTVVVHFVDAGGQERGAPLRCSRADMLQYLAQAERYAQPDSGLVARDREVPSARWFTPSITTRQPRSVTVYLRSGGTVEGAVLCFNADFLAILTGNIEPYHPNGTSFRAIPRDSVEYISRAGLDAEDTVARIPVHGDRHALIQALSNYISVRTFYDGPYLPELTQHLATSTRAIDADTIDMDESVVPRRMRPVVNFFATVATSGQTLVSSGYVYPTGQPEKFYDDSSMRGPTRGFAYEANLHLPMTRAFDLLGGLRYDRMHVENSYWPVACSSASTSVTLRAGGAWVVGRFDESGYRAMELSAGLLVGLQYYRVTSTYTTHGAAPSYPVGDPLTMTTKVETTGLQPNATVMIQSAIRVTRDLSLVIGADVTYTFTETRFLSIDYHGAYGPLTLASTYHTGLPVVLSLSIGASYAL